MIYRQKARNVGHPGCHKQLPVGDGWNSTLLWWFWGRCIIGFSNLHATYFINIKPAEMNIQLIQPTSSMFPKYTSQPTMPLKPSSAQKNHENKSWIERCSLGYGSTSWPKVVSVRHVQQICGFPCSMTMDHPHPTTGTNSSFTLCPLNWLMSGFPFSFWGVTYFGSP